MIRSARSRRDVAKIGRSVCDEPQAFAYFRTHGRGPDFEAASPALGARLGAAIVRLAMRELGAPSGALHVVGDAVVRPIVRVGEIAGRSAPPPIAAAEPLARSLDALVVRSGDGVAIANVADEGVRSPLRGAASLLGVPVPAMQQGAMGVLWVGDRRPRSWSSTEMDRLRGLAAELIGILPSDAGITEAARYWKSEMMYLLTADSPVGLYAVDERDGSVLIHNRCFLEIFGLQPFTARFDGCDVPHGEVLIRVSSQARRGRALRRVLTRLSDPTVRTSLEGDVALADGRVLHCYSAQIRDEGDGYLGRCYLVEDVTIRTASERAALEQAQLLDAIVAASPLAISVTDREGRISLWNPAAERLFGWSAAEVVGGPNPAIDPADADDCLRARERTLGGDALTDRELHVRSRSGEPLIVSVSTARLEHGGKGGGRLMTVFADVTAQRRLEARLRDAQKMEAIGRFAGAVAHDFNGVLTIVLGTAQLALEDAAAGTPLRRDLEAIRDAARHGADLTRRLLAFSRRAPLARDVLDVAAAVDETWPMLERLLPDRIALVRRGDTVGLPARVDRTELQQVLLNLVANARDALDGGGEIVITSDVINVPRDARPDGVPPGRYVRLRVQDNGAGISAEARPHLFEPLFTTKSTDSGTGLGLATVYGIVLQSQGHIVVDSEPGETVFDIYWPAAGAGAGHLATTSVMQTLS